MYTQVALARGSSRKLFVDLSEIAKHDAGTGIQRVVRAVFLALQETSPPEIEVCPVAADQEVSYRVLPPDFLEKRTEDPLAQLPPAQPQTGDAFLGLDLASAIAPRHEYVIAGWRAKGVSINVVVYDLLPFLHPRFFRRRTAQHFKRWLRFLWRQADQLIAISRTVADDLHTWRESAGGLRPVPVTTMRLAGDISASHPTHGMPEGADDILSWSRSRPTVLMVGTVEPRKGYDVAIRAYRRTQARFGAAAPQLLVVGRPGWKTKWLQHRMRRLTRRDSSFMWLENVSDEFLEQLYVSTIGLFMTSFAEGLGLPLLEAMSKNRPALVRDIPVFREVAREGVTFFRDAEPDALSKSLFYWSARVHSCDAIRENALHSSWRDTAEDLWQILGYGVVPDRTLYASNLPG